MVSLKPSMSTIRSESCVKVDAKLKNDDSIYIGVLIAQDAYCCVYINNGYIAFSTWTKLAPNIGMKLYQGRIMLGKGFSRSSKTILQFLNLIQHVLKSIIETISS